MALFRTLRVKEIIDKNDDVTKVILDDGSKAYCFHATTGSVELGDEVVINTTAVDLNLGTGGWHFVHWNLSRKELETPRGGHIMKMRYTSNQLDAGVEEEFDRYPREKSDIDGLKVIAAPLHSHIPAIASVIKSQNENANICVAISDGAALPIALSDNLRELKSKSLVNSTISFGHAFGADFEAINIYTALLSAKHVANCDVLIVSMGPGIVGTNSMFGFTGIEVAYHLDAAKVLQGNTYGVLRTSEADPRQRHQAISHHAITTFGTATHQRHNIGLISNHSLSPRLREQIKESKIDQKHDVIEVQMCGVVDMMESFDLNVKSMGRAARDDELFFESAGAAAQLVLRDGLN